MAEAQLFGLQDEFSCSMCLDIFSDPVSLSCGHSFCLKCLTDYWDQSQVCSCPQCRHTFTTRPELHRNTVLNEVIKKLKKMPISPPPSPPPSSENYAGLSDMECDICTEKTFRAVKSCLTCMASFCQTHLQPHYEAAALKHHKLTDPDRNLKEKLCAKHQKSLEIYCKTDKICICPICGVTEHNGHKMVELETERKEKQKHLGATLSEIRRRVEERKKTLKDTRRVMEQIKISAEEEIQECKKSFNDLIDCIEETCRKLTKRIREQEKIEMEKAEGVMEQLEKEIGELKRKDAEMRDLLETKDHIHFLQTFSSLCVLPADGDSLIFTVTADFSSEDLRKELSSLIKILEKINQGVIMTLTPPVVCSGCDPPVLQSPEPHSREDFLQYACSLTFDPNTTHRHLCLSEKNRKVTCGWTENHYPDHPDRFDRWCQVLCREVLTGTCCYWEVECSGDYMAIGVAYKGLSRKGNGLECHLGSNNMSWSLSWSYSQYSVHFNNKKTEISAPYGPRIGMYLDCHAGSLSFYRITDTMTLLHRFNASFTEPLYAGFWLQGDSSATLSCLKP
uniref:E3 ubiquitin-protein ligase TRIM16-like n=1 Tax=Erpetoichthys calabaricus TaxID=27687 RepID=A0A8C4XBV4_ERPCA